MSSCLFVSFHYPLLSISSLVFSPLWTKCLCDKMSETRKWRKCQGDKMPNTEKLDKMPKWVFSFYSSLPPLPSSSFSHPSFFHHLLPLHSYFCSSPVFFQYLSSF
ncbi:hypothetical protein ACQ4LE_002078 [Meloidogyne hapla]